MKLEDTIPLMLSDDYRKRGIAEYFQIKIRVQQNKEFIRKWKNNELTFTPLNSIEQSEIQLKAMELYLYTLRDRLRTVFNIEDTDDIGFEVFVLKFIEE